MSKDNGGPASDKIQQARRAAFEAAYEPEIHRIAAAYGAVKADILRAYRLDDCGSYKSRTVHAAWLGFNAALDAVEVELPQEDERGRITRTSAMRAIESTNLGIKVK